MKPRLKLPFLLPVLFTLGVGSASASRPWWCFWDLVGTIETTPSWVKLSEQGLTREDFRRQNSSLFAERSWEAFSRSDMLEHLSDFQQIRNGVGLGTRTAYLVRYQGQRILLRLTNARRGGLQTRNEETVLREAQWMQAFHRIGLAPRFYSLALDQSGFFAVLSEYVEGHHYQWYRFRDIPREFIKDSHIEGLRQIGRILEGLGVVQVDEVLQVRLTPKGRVILVDFERFAFRENAAASRIQAELMADALDRFRQGLSITPEMDAQFRGAVVRQ